MVEAPGFYDLVPAYYDGEQFLIHAARFFDLLGYNTETGDGHLLVQDAVQRYRIELVGGETPLASIDTLVRVLGPDIFFDEVRLSLVLSSAAEHFDTAILAQRAVLPGQAPGPIAFGRQRRVLGGVVASYDASWGGHKEFVGNVHYVASALGGTLSGESGSLRYILDLPYKHWLTQVELARTQEDRVVRLSNRPLGSRHLHRRSSFAGRTQPHALVEALVSGVVADRVVADSEGRYRIVVPVYYGSTDVVVRHRPPASGVTREERVHVFTSSELVESGRLYYDLTHGRERKHFSAAYGVLPRLTLRADGEEGRYYRRLWMGVAASPWSSVFAETDVDAGSGILRAQLHYSRPRLRANAYYTSEPQQLSTQITGQHRGLSNSIAVAKDADSWSLRQITSYYGQSGILAEWVYSRQQHEYMPAYQHMRAALGHSGSVGRLAARASVGASLGQHTRAWEVHGFAALKRFSLGIETSYDVRQKAWNIGATLRADIGVATLNSSVDQSGHQWHTLRGSASIGSKMRLSQASHSRSSAVLRVFEDRNGNKKLDAGELLPEVEAQLYHASLQRMRDGTLRAEHLEPFTAYQVQILESSIRDPLLRPLPGYDFSFIADPGRTKVVDIPLVRPAHIVGRIDIQDRAASRLEVRVLDDAVTSTAAAVYRDGGFSLRLHPGHFVLQLRDVVSGDVLAEQELNVAPDSRRIELWVTIP